MKCSFREKMDRHQKMMGTHVSLNDPEVTEILGYMGFDYIWIDMEHTCIDYKSLYAHLLAAREAGTDVLVRVPQNDLVSLKKVLEMGPEAVVFPMVKTVEEAEDLISHCVYPPAGCRGFGPRRAVRYGLADVDQYIKKDSFDICRFIQIEHVDTIECLEELVQIEYLDGFIIGPRDLSGSYGHLEDPYGEETAAKILHCAEIVKKAGKYFGLSIGDFDTEAIQYWSAKGVEMLSAGADTDYIIYGAKEARRNLIEQHIGA